MSSGHRRTASPGLPRNTGSCAPSLEPPPPFVTLGLAFGDGFFASVSSSVARSGEIWTSGDGTTWTLRSAGHPRLAGVVHVNHTFVAVGQDGTILQSDLTGFSDVPPGYWAERYIRALYFHDVTAGCGGTDYCPESPVTRGQMAVFLLRALDVAPPACVVPTFGDVPCTHLFADWIEELVRRGITAGCGGGLYCPTGPVTRAQMAVFLVGAFGLPL